LARRALERYGYKVLEASLPTEAERLCQQHKDTISLLITDVVMPEMGGKELAQKLTHWHPEMRVLYISGYTDDALAQHGVRDPGLAFLEKPFTPLELVCKVRQVLDAPAQGA
jgi:DNA-binding NtrC family response regulator